MARIGSPRVSQARYRPRRMDRFLTALRTPKGIAVVGTALLITIASSVMAAVMWTQAASVTNGSQDSDITFADGGGGVADFATVTIGSSGASASISLTGVAGAANFQVTDLLQISNGDATQDYSITLGRDSVPNAAITSLVFTVLDGATVIKTYDAVAAASATAFTLSATDTYDIRIDMAITDGTAVGSLGSVDLEFTIAPV